VLDNQNMNILLWSETGYRFVKRQSQSNPNVTIIGIGPEVDHSPVFNIGQRFDSPIDQAVNSNQVHPLLSRERNVAPWRLEAGALAGLLRTEFHPSERRLCDLEDIGAALRSCRSREHVDGVRC